MTESNRDTLYRLLHDREKDLQANQYDIIRTLRELEALYKERDKLFEDINDIRAHIKRVESEEE
jgi:predicted  nucleic acid-binding Zn-ribbon protein